MGKLHEDRIFKNLNHGFREKFLMALQTETMRGKEKKHG